MTAFAGESQARNRYTYFASKAKKEGYEQVAGIFSETADQEKEHAERLFKFLEGGMAEIQWSFPAGVIGSTIDNLTEAAAGEREEWSDMYPSFAKIADEEGFPVIAAVMRHIAVAESGHEARFLALLERIKTGTSFVRDEAIEWQCRNCGYIHNGKQAPEHCPACAHPQAYFEPRKTNF